MLDRRFVTGSVEISISSNQTYLLFSSSKRRGTKIRLTFYSNQANVLTMNISYLYHFRTLLRECVVITCLIDGVIFSNYAANLFRIKINEKHHPDWTKPVYTSENIRGAICCIKTQTKKKSGLYLTNPLNRTCRFRIIVSK